MIKLNLNSNMLSGESLRPSIVRSWTTSYKIAKRFAYEYIKGREEAKRNRVCRPKRLSTNL